MAKRKAETVSVHEIPAEVVGAVVLADIAQIKVEAETHPDPDARRRIEIAAERLRQIALNEMSPATMAEMMKTQ